MWPHSFLYGLSVAALAVQQQSCVITRETVLLAKPNLFFIWPFAEKVCQILI